MRDYIKETTSIEELMVTIAENGFFPGEPPIVEPSDKETGKFVVVEGNRQLTAVKLLNDPSFCTHPGERMDANESTLQRSCARDWKPKRS